jgi:acetoin utilization deacetylase AcuC-like enzyme
MYVIYDNFYLKHDSGPGHPENAGRLAVIKKELEGPVLKERIVIKKPLKAAGEEIELIHDKDYIKKVKRLSESGGTSYLDPDTVVTEHTYDCALLAAGGCFKGLDLIFNKNSRYSNFFAAIRPPGHHASRSAGSGFCIFNNVALGSEYAMQKYGVKRIAIIDFDAHHGNGTQGLFYNNKSVMYISFHQYPHYPGTGNLDETGTGEGEGFNMNFPFASRTGEEDYLAAFRDIIIPVMERFKPELFLVSAGYDSHLLDQLSSLNLTEESYYKIMCVISYLSSKYSGGRTGILLEGGYNYGATAKSVIKTIEGCLNSKGSQKILDKDAGPAGKIWQDWNLREDAVKNGSVLNKIRGIFKV